MISFCCYHFANFLSRVAKRRAACLPGCTDLETPPLPDTLPVRSGWDCGIQAGGPPPTSSPTAHPGCHPPHSTALLARNHMTATIAPFVAVCCSNVLIYTGGNSLSRCNRSFQFAGRCFLQVGLLLLNQCLLEPTTSVSSTNISVSLIFHASWHQNDPASRVQSSTQTSK